MGQWPCAHSLPVARGKSRSYSAHRDPGPNLQPLQAPADVLWRVGERSVDRLSPFLEVLPPFVVDRDGGPWANKRAQLDGLFGRHRVAQRPRNREAHTAEVQERDVDLEPLCDLAHTVVQHRVTRDPEHAVFLTLPAQREADHVAHDRATERRSVAARSRGDLDWQSPRCLQPGRCPRLESARGYNG